MSRLEMSAIQIAQAADPRRPIWDILIELEGGHRHVTDIQVEQARNPRRPVKEVLAAMEEAARIAAGERADETIVTMPKGKEDQVDLVPDDEYYEPLVAVGGRR